MNFRIGQGFDAHSFTEGEFVVLGGVRIPHSKKLKAHSDGDVLLHALCDALLGAMALGDIGRHFPDTDPRYEDIDSRELLRKVVALMVERDLVIGNIDLTIIAQAPKIAPYVNQMQANLADDLKTVPENINVKASTTEEMGFTGRGEGIAAMAVVLLNTH